jgi:hypothetical protein
MKNAPHKQLLANIDPKMKTCFLLILGFVSTNKILFALETLI